MASRRVATMRSGLRHSKVVMSQASTATITPLKSETMAKWANARLRWWRNQWAGATMPAGPGLALNPRATTAVEP